MYITMQDAANRHSINMHKQMLESVLKIQLDPKVTLHGGQVTFRHVGKKCSNFQQ